MKLTTAEHKDIMVNRGPSKCQQHPSRYVLAMMRTTYIIYYNICWRSPGFCPQPTAVHAALFAWRSNELHQEKCPESEVLLSEEV